MRTAIAMLVAATILAAADTAGAQTLPITLVTPKDNAVLPPATSAAFIIESPELAANGTPSLTVEIATQPTLGQDGTLAAEFTVDSFPVRRGDAYPTRYSGATRPVTSWTMLQRTYYWMAYCHCTGGEPITSAVHKLTVASPDTALRPTVQASIKDGIGRAYGLLTSCRVPSSMTARCEASWRDTRRASRRTRRYRGTLTIRAQDAGWLYSFSGKRARQGCVARYDYKTCTEPSSWSGVIDQDAGQQP